MFKHDITEKETIQADEGFPERERDTLDTPTHPRGADRELRQEHRERRGIRRQRAEQAESVLAMHEPRVLSQGRHPEAHEGQETRGGSQTAGAAAGGTRGNVGGEFVVYTDGNTVENGYCECDYLGTRAK